MIKALSIITFGKLISQASALVFFVVLAKYVSVEEYGRYAIYLLLVAISDYFSRETIENTLVLRLASKLSFIKSLFLLLFADIFLSFCILMYLSQIAYVEFLLLLVTKLSVWIGAYYRGGSIYHREYKRYSVILSVSTVVAVCVGLIFLRNGYGIQAAMYQQLTLWGGSVVIYIITRDNHIAFDRDFFPLVSKPGLNKISLSAFFNFITARGDLLVVATLGNPQLTGIYQFSRRIYQIYQDVMISGVEKVFLSSSLESDREYYYFLLCIFISLISITAGVMLFPYLVGTIFSPDWLEALNALTLLSLGAIGLITGSISKSTLSKIDEFGCILRVRIFELLLMFLSVIYLWFHFSIEILCLLLSFRYFLSNGYLVIKAGFLKWGYVALLSPFLALYLYKVFLIFRVDVI
ncbi:oligosaccharide flippase family protein [Thalassolituus oleivorans]|uniref:oligosaccharide flippase family protein n=1 Tax=Thalassolituus oleivorans TaxID=187493 RepID=UPI00042DC28F|nr:oligosaccharide flippase family protein [Thalassolituus oleivorans]AHK17388.1 hypothetical protein R615_04840 [Thalassolituus oleivorans R6-15]